MGWKIDTRMDMQDGKNCLPRSLSRLLSCDTRRGRGKGRKKEEGYRRVTCNQLDCLPGSRSGPRACCSRAPAPVSSVRSDTRAFTQTHFFFFSAWLLTTPRLYACTLGPSNSQRSKHPDKEKKIWRQTQRGRERERGRGCCLKERGAQELSDVTYSNFPSSLSLSFGCFAY